MHNPRSLGLTFFCIIFTVAMAACGKQEVPAPESPSPPARAVQAPQPSAPASTAMAASVVQGWQGTWFGPEGMSLTLVAKENAKYEVTIDETQTFEGVAGPDYIAFERDGVQERIKATDGEATGMKWLADESNCLTIKEGEGYCRK